MVWSVGRYCIYLPGRISYGNGLSHFPPWKDVYIRWEWACCFSYSPLWLFFCCMLSLRSARDGMGLVCLVCLVCYLGFGLRLCYGDIFSLLISILFFFRCVFGSTCCHFGDSVQSTSCWRAGVLLVFYFFLFAEKQKKLYVLRYLPTWYVCGM